MVLRAFLGRNRHPERDKSDGPGDHMQHDKNKKRVHDTLICILNWTATKGPFAQRHKTCLEARRAAVEQPMMRAAG